MIAEIFDSMFRPLSDDEWYGRIKDVLPALQQFEREYNARREKDGGEDELWSDEMYDLFDKWNDDAWTGFSWTDVALAFTGDDDETAGHMIGHTYLKWKALHSGD